MKLVLSRWPGFTPSDVCDILLTGLHGVGGTAGASVQRGESVIVNTAPGQVFTIHMTEQPQVEVSSEV